MSKSESDGWVDPSTILLTRHGLISIDVIGSHQHDLLQSWLKPKRWQLFYQNSAMKVDYARRGLPTRLTNMESVLLV
eukprot:CAMPEP_0195279812 /NCGR_PEP_ID=MMETSP0706-20130129/20699_1 /TAXON_ID=33640 /ORGANISM="Asterionellopsis glacialis, Strain CCMP134" /LENGTH=76 /DNA_ID=CAMNT_0040338407 /DNA_START=77 /DNA_END=307 /DNA_ORIENTATION=-